MKQRESLINQLASDLEPVQTVGGGVAWRAFLWLALSTSYVVFASAAVGPVRPGAIEQLITQPRFLLECLAGIAAIVLLAYTGFRSAVPGALSRRGLVFAIGFTLLWLVNYPLGFISPALEPSMLGKRYPCYLETLMLGLPPAIAAVYWQQKLFPLRPVVSAMLIGLAAGMLPALYMQIACMYAPAHILLWHILPGVLVACLAPVALLPAVWRRQ